MSLLYPKHTSRPLTLDNPAEPELYRDVFPYTHISRIEFDDTFLIPRPAEPMFITDTTFRDGQQARPPYTVKQIARIFEETARNEQEHAKLWFKALHGDAMPDTAESHRSVPGTRLPLPEGHGLDTRQHGRPQNRP